MKSILRVVFLVNMILVAPGVFGQGSLTKPWLKAFKEVDSLAVNGQPKAALTLVNNLSERARAEGNTPMLIKTVIHRMLFQSKLEEDYFYKIVVSLKKDIQAARQPEKSILQSLLAESYWQFYQLNRYQFIQRSNLSADPGGDIRAWSVKKITDETVKEFLASLSEARMLQEVDLGIFAELLAGNSSTRNLRPTLYDLLAYRAISVLMNAQSTLGSFDDENTILNDPSWFSGREIFSSKEISTKDSTSFALGAIKIFQNLLRYHIAKRNIAALADADLKRLAFIYQRSRNENRDLLYLDALRLLSELAKGTEIYPDVLYAQALVYNTSYDHTGARKPDLVKVLELTAKLRKEYPDSYAAKKAESLAVPITRRSLTVQIGAYSIPNSASQILISHKNCDTAYFRIYKIPLTDDDFFFNQEDRFNAFVKSHVPDLSWSVNLPDYSDYQIHTFADKIAPLSAGGYALIASSSRDKNKEGYTSSAITFNVTSLAVNSRPGPENVTEYLVLDRRSGIKIESAKVQIIFSEQKDGKRMERYGPASRSNKGGLALIPGNTNGRRALITYNRDSLLVTSRNSDMRNAEVSHPRLILFTDRPIYRPGQQVYFKGLLIRDKAGENTIVTGQLLEISLRDVNLKEIEKVSLTTNDYGTIQGSFTIPMGKLNGGMQLTSIFGRISIQVEEYKRPTFEVIFDKPNQRYRVNDSIRVAGKAITFAGYPLGDANVRYTIYRTVHHPTRYTPYSPPQQISFGSTKTSKEGGFIIPFFSMVRPGWKENYTYQVKAEITDLSGETITGTKSINAGEKDIIVKANVPDVIFLKSTPDSLSFNLVNLNGEPVSARLKADWQLLRQPGRLISSGPFNIKPEKYALESEEFRKIFPFEAYNGDDDPANWPVSGTVLQQDINSTSGSGVLNVSARNLEAGYYKLRLTGINAFGDTVVSDRIVRAYTDQATQIQSMTEWLVVKESSIRKGEQAEFRVAGALPSSRVYYEIYYRGDIVEKVWVNTSPIQKIIRITPQARFSDGFAVQFTMVQNGNFYHSLQKIQIEDPSNDLDIRFLSFRDKLQPGEKDSWKLSISSKNGERKAAELVATLYDASLESFRKMNWDVPVSATFYYEMFNWDTSPNYLRTAYELWFYRKDDRNSYYAERKYEYLYMYTDGYVNYATGYNNYIRKLEGTRLRERSELAIKKLERQLKAELYYGIVTDNYGNLLTGVKVKAGKSTANTDENGIYIIHAKSGDLLDFSSFGLSGIVVKTGEDKRIDIRFLNIDRALSETAVVGYGVPQTQSATASSRVMLRGISSIAGKVPGVNVAEEKSAKEFASVETNEQASNIYSIDVPAQTEPRTNFAETAFFYPQLRTNEKGEINIEFTIPQSLTRYKMLGFAHTKDFRTATISRELITQKQLAITANAPRFFRERDTIFFTARLNNLAGKDLDGEASLEFRDALTGNVIGTILGQATPIQKFSLSGGGNGVLKWRLIIPEGMSAITYRLLASSGRFSDGEYMSVPVLPNSMLVTESIPLNVRGNATKNFALDKLLASVESNTLRNYKLTLEFTSNPLWYAIQALPYMMEYPYECAEQTFSRLYANSFATGIVNSAPEIRAVFNSWQNTDAGKALLSNLEKNQDVKSILLEETPWVRAAGNEGERKRRMAVLFDLNRMNYEMRSNLDKLGKMQKPNGSFPWFTGMQDDRYITQHIVLGIGQLKKLKLIAEADMPAFDRILNKAIRFLDTRLIEDHKQEIREKRISYLPLHYLYARSYSAISKDADFNRAMAFYLKKIAETWKIMEPYQQGQAALVLSRSGQKAEAVKIISMLKQTARLNDETGMYWAANRLGWWWYQNPVETQALLIEAFDEVASDQASVEEMKIWILKNKQTTNWQTTKTTAAACYALMMRGASRLTGTVEPDILVGGKNLADAGFPAMPKEAGTGYRRTSIEGIHVKPEMGNVEVKNNSRNIAWGGLYWQYFENLDKIKPAETGITIRKELFLQKLTGTGNVLAPLTRDNILKPGDLLTVRIEIHTDRDMEYVHLKDMRSSGFEPVNVISQYKYQGGLGYYESTKDASSNFFISYLRKGVYVFEYALRVNQSGNFSNGITTIQSMYAPEFAAHSAGTRVSVE